VWDQRNKESKKKHPPTTTERVLQPADWWEQERRIDVFDIKPSLSHAAGYRVFLARKKSGRVPGRGPSAGAARKRFVARHLSCYTSTMHIRFHAHALARLSERGATQNEVTLTIRRGERFTAKFDRTGFRMNFPFNSVWGGRKYATKQVEVYAEEEKRSWLVITVITRYY